MHRCQRLWIIWREPRFCSGQRAENGHVPDEVSWHACFDHHYANGDVPRPIESTAVFFERSYMNQVNQGPSVTSKQSNRTGAILLLVAVTMVGLMSLLVLAIDGGNLQQEKRFAQTAADAAALAGAQEIYRNHTTLTEITDAARAEAQRNGFQNGVGGDSVDVIYPATGTYP